MASDLRLTDEQRAAAEAPDGPLLLLAGPGTGKTAVLAARVAVLLSRRQLPPRSLLLVTFARRAAQELQHRLCRLLGPPGQAVQVQTIHALGLQIVRRWSEVLGYGAATPAVLDARRAQELLGTAAQQVGLDLERYPLPLLAQLVERVRLDAKGPAPPAPLAALLQRYTLLLRQRHAVDYAAMLELPLHLFRTCPAALARCQERYAHVLCDEAQDLQPAQYSLLRSLAQRHHRLTLVGDPLQQLYGWRGADGRCFEQFRQDFPAATVVQLQETFRSSGRIVALANALSAAAQTPQRLWTRRAAGPPIRLQPAADPAEEAAAVVAQVQRLVATHAIAGLSEVAVLARTNAQLAEVVAACRRRRVPCRAGGSAATPALWLATVHQAKGREWPVVFLIGCEEGLLPHAAALGPPEDPRALASEWCVAYVAVTRARERLYLSYCRRRRVGPRLELRRPSRFLAAIPAEAADQVA